MSLPLNYRTLSGIELLNEIDDNKFDKNNAAKVEQEFNIVCRALEVTPMQLLLMKNSELKERVMFLKYKIKILATRLIRKGYLKDIKTIQNANNKNRQESGGDNEFQNLCEAAKIIATQTQFNTLRNQRSNMCSPSQTYRKSSHELTPPPPCPTPQSNRNNTISNQQNYPQQNYQNDFQSSMNLRNQIPVRTKTNQSFQQIPKYTKPEYCNQAEYERFEKRRYPKQYYNNNVQRNIPCSTPKSIYKPQSNPMQNVPAMKNLPNSTFSCPDQKQPHLCKLNQLQTNMYGQQPRTNKLSDTRASSSIPISPISYNSCSTKQSERPSSNSIKDKTFEDILNDILRSCQNIRRFFKTASSSNFPSNPSSTATAAMVTLLNACEIIQHKYGDLIDSTKCTNRNKSSYVENRQSRPNVKSTNKYLEQSSNAGTSHNTQFQSREHTNQGISNKNFNQSLDYTIEDCED